MKILALLTVCVLTLLLLVPVKDKPKQGRTSHEQAMIDDREWEISHRRIA